MGEIHEGVAVFFFLAVASVALFSFIAVASWSDARRREREAYYTSETLRRIAESSQPGAPAALEYLREEQRVIHHKRREGMKLGGMITAGVGLATLIFLKAIVGYPVYLCALIPLFVGLVLVAHAFMTVAE